MLSLFFLSLALIASVIYILRNKKSRVADNRYQRKTPVLHAESTAMGESEIAKQLYDDVSNLEAIDDVLGIATPKKTEIKIPTRTHTHTPNHVVAVYLMATEGGAYTGYELLQALLSAGLRYGKQNIFHRHAHKDGRGDVLFHCASAIPPGTFDLTQMGSFSCKGLCLFFEASSVDE